LKRYLNIFDIIIVYISAHVSLGS